MNSVYGKQDIMFIVVIKKIRQKCKLTLAFRAVCVQLCSISLVAGLLMCLYSAAKITHKTQAMTSVAAAWHTDATVHAFDNDQENPDPDLPPTAGYLAPANAYRVAAGDESASDDDDDDSRSECSSLDDPKYVPFQANNISFQKRQALGK